MRGARRFDLAELSSLLEQIYDAALEPERWRETMQALARAAGGEHAVLQAVDLRSNSLAALYHNDVPRQAVEDFNARFIAIDPRIAHIEREGLGKLYHDGLVTDEQGMDRSEYYVDFVGKHGWRYASFMGLHADGPIQTGFSIQRTRAQGLATAEQEDLLRALAPHLRRAARLTVELGAARLQVASSAAALDRLALGVAILDSGGRVLHANVALRAMAAAGDGIALAGDGLRFGHRMAQAAASRLLADAIATGAGSGRAAGGTAQVTRPSGKRPYQITVSPLPLPAGTPLFLARRPAAVVLVTDPDAATVAPAERLRALYRLTPREAELAIWLGAGSSLREAARALDIAERTARSHLAAIFLKTGTSRQAELIRLLATMVR